MLFWFVLTVLFLAFRNRRTPQAAVSEAANSTEFMDWVRSKGSLSHSLSLVATIAPMRIANFTGMGRGTMSDSASPQV